MVRGVGRRGNGEGRGIEFGNGREFSGMNRSEQHFSVKAIHVLFSLSRLHTRSFLLTQGFLKLFLQQYLSDRVFLCHPIK